MNFTEDEQGFRAIVDSHITLTVAGGVLRVDAYSGDGRFLQ